MAGLLPDPSSYQDLIFPNIKKPLLDGYFSIDVNRRYVNDLRNLKYLKMPDKKEVTIDLNTKLSTYCEKPESSRNEKLDQMLEYILINFDRLLNRQTNCLNCDVVAFRGLLKLLMACPYESREDFIILATKYKNTIYLLEEESERKKSERLNRTTEHKKFLKYGFIFEHFMLNDGPKKSTHKKDDVIESEEFCCVFSTKLEKHAMLYGAEMDGIKSSKIVRNLEDLRKSEFVELKLKRRESNERQVSNFYRFKTKNWWAQSFLVGIENICVGIRDDEGIVKEVVNMSLRDIVHQSKPYWSASICLKFLNDFLIKVKKDMSGIDCPLTVFKYTYDPQKDKKINLVKFVGENLHSFLPKHYITFLDEID